MDKKILIVFFCCLLVFVEINQIRAQLNLKRDDFLGSGPTARRAWWRYHNEGTGQYPTPESGYLRLILQDADATLGEYCNSGIWDGYNMYTEVKIRVRAKAITEPYPGTRGWGLWYSEPFTYDPVMHNAWFLQQAEIPEGYPEDNYWRAQISRGVSWSNHHYIDLETIADISEWHLYEISREFNPDAVSLSIDGTEVLYDDHNIPYRDFSFHTWIDNQIYHIVEDSTEWAVYRRSFEGTSETIIDFVEILTIDSTGKNFTAGGNVLLRKIPNSMGNGGSQVLWKSYGLNSPAVNGVLLLTGRAENYGIYSDDDDIRIMIDDQDFGWDSDLSLNGQTLQDASKTLLIEQSLDAGDHIISIYSDQTPLLYDATFLGSSNGGIIFDQEYHETAPGGTDYEWKSINFGTQGGEVNIYISGTANEDPTPSGYGRYYSSYGDGEDDDLRIELDEINYGYHTDESFYGNRLFGEPQSILITETLSRGWHTLKIYANNTPTLYRVTIYGGNDDTPLPVTLSAFQVSVESQSNLIRWRTESELNNLGFNLYRAFSENIIPLSKLEFLMINPRLINGAGNSNLPRYYSYKDTDVKNNYYYWYQLEDVDFNGNKKKHPIQRVFRSESMAEDFKLYQNYPNPFNNMTNIIYELPIPSSVTWNIYSIDGKLVAWRKYDQQNAGSYTVHWKGINQSGTQLSSGIYYFHLLAGDVSKTIPLILLR